MLLENVQYGEDVFIKKVSTADIDTLNNGLNDHFDHKSFNSVFSSWYRD